MTEGDGHAGPRPDAPPHCSLIRHDQDRREDEEMPNVVFIIAQGW